jgi:hypothetical protein
MRTKAAPTLFSGIQILAVVLLGCNEPAAMRRGTGSAGGAQLTAVYARADRDYVRIQNPDGTFRPESYMFKNGGNFGGPRVDNTIDRLNFDDVSAVIAAPLATQNYVPSQDPETTALLIVVYWGTTLAPNDVNPLDARASVQLNEQAERAETAAKEGNAADAHLARQLRQEASDAANSEARMDGRTDAQNANILGYTDEIFRTSPHDPQMNTLQNEVEEDRYYVVLLAYDYQLARKGMQRRLLWETRFSIPERRNDFQKALPLMASIASRYFGQNSQGLIHHNLGEGRVEVGEPKSLGTIPAR